MNKSLSKIIAHELDTTPAQILSAITLLDEGNTVPFIARYRKKSQEDYSAANHLIRSKITQMKII